MASEDCCYLVGNFFSETGLASSHCLISVNNNINTDLNDHGCADLLPGATMGSINIAAYAGDRVHKGCPGRAGVQILWMRKLNCDDGSTFFIYLGGGRSFSSGEASSHVTLLKPAESTTKLVSASAQSGPAALFTNTEQLEGLGLSYSGGPIDVDTSTESGCRISNMGIGSGDYYLQNFSIEFVPGSIPVANYTYAYNV